MENLVKDIIEVRKQQKPVAFAWHKACDIIGADPHWRVFGELFFHHPDLVYSINSYHNHYHSAEAVLSGAYLAVYEFIAIEPREILIFAMLVHDLAHNGSHNTYPHELELKAHDSLVTYSDVNPAINIYWNSHLLSLHGTYPQFLETMKDIIIATDFHTGPAHNAAHYCIGDTISQLKMLANEADTLASVLPELGIERGHLLSLEQNNPSIDTPQAREKFLSQVHYVSLASKHYGIEQYLKVPAKKISLK